MNKEFIDFLKSKVSIVEVISGKIRLRRSGRDWFGLCPFHKEKTGSFKVDADKGFYYCFGCGAHGDAIKFVQDFEKITFVEAVEFIANLYGIPLPSPNEKAFIDPNKPVYDVMNEIKNWFMQQLKEPIGTEAVAYLKSRNISSESMEKFHLGFAPNNNYLFNYLIKKGFSYDILLKTGVYNRSKYNSELTCRYNGRLIFPIIDSIGKCIGFGGRILHYSADAAKYINSPETEIFTKSDHLYGYFLARRGQTREIILTEGYLDVISMHQAGFDGAVAPLGTSISEPQINMCWKVCNTPIISLDGDSAGIKASYRWIDKILPLLKAGYSFKFAKLPEGTDPDELIFNHREEIIKKAIKNAAPLSDWIWDGAFLLYPSGTPEQKAAIVKMLLDKVETIQDISLKKLYIQNLRQKERDLYRRKFTLNTGSSANIRPATSADNKLEKIFVVTVINHPYIIDVIIESLVSLELKNFEMQKIKEKILDCYHNYYLTGELDKYNEIMLQLRNDMTEDMKEVVLHAAFSGEESTAEDAVSGWLELINRYSSQQIVSEDLQRASSNLKSTFSEEDWRRLKALKKEIFLKRTKKEEI